MPELISRNHQSAGRLALAAAVSLLGVALAGCSSTVDKINQMGSIDYKSESSQKQLPPLEIPPDLKSPGRDERFTMPNVPPDNSGSATLSAFNASRTTKTSAANASVLPVPPNVRMERAGSQRWLVVNAPPDRVWPLVKEFWQQNGFLLNVDDADTGVMETDWAENRAKVNDGMVRNTLSKFLDQMTSTGERDKFRTRLERGAQPDTTEIYVSHRGMVEVVGSNPNTIGSSVWQPRPSDPELEAEFLGRIMMHLGLDNAQAQRVLASDSKSVDRAKLVKAPDGGSAVEVSEPFDRAWRRVGLALDRGGFTVEDRDRSKGYYYVRYVDPDADAATKKDTGLFSKLAFWKPSDPKKSEQYRILVRDAKDTSQVQVQNKDGGTDSSDTARRILALLQEQLK
jgi:outer membrane protein assembly factor BamC